MKSWKLLSTREKAALPRYTIPIYNHVYSQDLDPRTMCIRAESMRAMTRPWLISSTSA